MTKNKELSLGIKTIVPDKVRTFMNTLNIIFPNTIRIAYLFHFKQDILRNIKKYILYKKSKKNNELINKLAQIAILYKDDIDFVKNQINILINEYPQYTNFIKQKTENF